MLFSRMTILAFATAFGSTCHGAPTAQVPPQLPDLVDQVSIERLFNEPACFLSADAGRRVACKILDLEMGFLTVTIQTFVAGKARPEHSWVIYADGSTAFDPKAVRPKARQAAEVHLRVAGFKAGGSSLPIDATTITEGQISVARGGQGAAVGALPGPGWKRDRYASCCKWTPQGAVDFGKYTAVHLVATCAFTGNPEAKSACFIAGYNDESHPNYSTVAVLPHTP